ncbi:MAG: hypothetical protein H6974_03505 [Gammaproteobacteria bacterium]|nr:hypothetical protein [Gammaproteobacteria bacterium]
MITNFCVTCYGLSASRWASFVLASDPRVFIAHGTYALDSIVNGSFNAELIINENNNLDALKRGRELHTWIKQASLKALYARYREIYPDAEVYGNIHSFVPTELYAKKDINEILIMVINLIRNPICFIDCHNTIVMNAESIEELKKQYAMMYINRVLPNIETLNALDLQRYKNAMDRAFLISCFSVIDQAEDIIKYPIPLFRMEALTTDAEYLANFCYRVSGLTYAEATLESFIAKGAINNHRSRQALRQPEEIWAAWAPHHRDAFNALVARPYAKVFASVGYPLN